MALWGLWGEGEEAIEAKVTYDLPEAHVLSILLLVEPLVLRYLVLCVDHAVHGFAG